MNKVKKQVSDACFVTVFTDASNHKDVRLFLLMIRYFVPLLGVQIKILEIESLPGETAEIICQFIANCLLKHELKEKIVGFAPTIRILILEDTNCFRILSDKRSKAYWKLV